MNKPLNPDEFAAEHGRDASNGPEVRRIELERLSKLDPIEYDRQREQSAELLGCRVSTLDAEVARFRPKAQGEDKLQGKAVTLPDAEAWPAKVSGSVLLDALAAAVRDHVALAPPAADAVAAWIAHTWTFDVFGITPRLALQAPEKASGKSTLLDLVSMLVPRPLLASSVSAAAIFRTVEKFKPTLLLDEADQWMSSDDDRLGILNAGHRRGAPAVRCVGDDAEPRAFDVYSPVALAGIGRLPATLQDRSVVVVLRRALPEERKGLRAVRTDRPELFNDLRRRCRRWADDSRLFLADHEPEIPDQLTNRRADNWRPLFAIADQAGGPWPARMAAAASLLEAGSEEGGEMGMRLQLLADIRAIMMETWGKKSSEELAAFAMGPERPKIASGTLVERLVEIDDSPWGEMPHGGKKITPHSLARLLKPWGIRTADKNVRGAVLKHYAAADFLDLFARYLPAVDP